MHKEPEIEGEIRKHPAGGQVLRLPRSDLHARIPSGVGLPQQVTGQPMRPPRNRMISRFRIFIFIHI